MEVERSLHPAEHRGYRELYAFARQLSDHWSVLARRLGAGTPAGLALERGGRAARDLIRELEPVTAGYDLHGRPAAQGLGEGIARLRIGLRDRFLERGQALRFAVEDAQHVTTLLAFLAAAAESHDDAELAEQCGRWERKLRRHESAARKAAAELGATPDSAIEPLDSSFAGHLAHGIGHGLGTLGEWVDRRTATRGDPGD